MTKYLYGHIMILVWSGKNWYSYTNWVVKSVGGPTIRNSASLVLARKTLIYKNWTHHFVRVSVSIQFHLNIVHLNYQGWTYWLLSSRSLTVADEVIHLFVTLLHLEFMLSQRRQLYIRHCTRCLLPNLKRVVIHWRRVYNRSSLLINLLLVIAHRIRHFHCV